MIRAAINYLRSALNRATAPDPVKIETYKAEEDEFAQFLLEQENQSRRSVQEREQRNWIDRPITERFRGTHNSRGARRD